MASWEPVGSVCLVLKPSLKPNDEGLFHTQDSEDGVSLDGHNVAISHPEEEDSGMP